MKRRVMAVAGWLGVMVLGACGGDEHAFKISTRFDASTNSGGLTTSQALATSIEGLYFGELEIVAYDRRQGESVQTHAGASGFTGEGWSYWMVLPNGYDTGRDNVLKTGEVVDIDAWTEWVQELEQPFVDEVGAFDIDLFEVYIYRTGVIYDGAFYGMNADNNGLDKHPLHKYPEWSSIEDYYCMPTFDGFTYTQDVNVFFVRSDWISTPVLVDFDNSAFVSASRELSESESELITDLVAKGTTRRFYDSLVFIPFDGPVTVKLRDDAEASGDHVIESGQVEFSVGFDLTDIIDEATNWSVPELFYRGDADGVPFGLTVGFEALPEAE